MTYAEKLKDPRWQKKRLEVMERDDFKCKLCNDDSKTLHVHHKSYQYGKEPWDYELDNFTTLCYDCHELEEFAKEKFNELIYKLEVQGHFKHKIVQDFHKYVYLKLKSNG